MTPEWLSAVVAAVCAVSTLASVFVSLWIKLGLQTFKNELREWINGSFMRSAEVRGMFHDLERRVGRLEKNQDKAA